MSAAYKLSSSTQADFSAVDRRFASLKQQMLTTEFRALSHSALERHLHREGMELMREMLQALLTLKGQAVPVGPVIGADGVERTHMRKGTTRRLESVFGEVVVERASHSSRGLSALRPVDAALNVPNDRYSLEVRRRVGLAAAQASFDKALASLQLTTAAGVPKRQAEQLAVRAAKDFDGFYATRCAAPLTAQPGPFLILSVDQKGVVMHPEDLRLATKKLAAKARSAKHESRYSRGEPHGRKRMATVAAVYTIEPYARTAPDVIHALCRVKEAPSQRPRPQRKRVWASITKAPIDVIEAAFAEAKYRDPYHQKQWFVLIDGNPDLERWVKEVARRRGFPITIVLDFIHALEWLWRAVYAFHEQGTPEAEKWVLTRMERILRGDATMVAAGIARSATRRGLSAAQRKVVDQCTHYIHAHKHKMLYPECLLQGVPIGTGVIEGACRHLICDRLDITGARWRLVGAEAILRLRAIIASGDFEEYWQFHEGEEWRRNHASLYADDTVPKVAHPGKPRHLRLAPTPS